MLRQFLQGLTDESKHPFSRPDGRRSRLPSDRGIAFGRADPIGGRGGSDGVFEWLRRVRGPAVS